MSSVFRDDMTFVESLVAHARALSKCKTEEEIERLYREGDEWLARQRLLPKREVL